MTQQVEPTVSFFPYSGRLRWVCKCGSATLVEAVRSYMLPLSLLNRSELAHMLRIRSPCTPTRLPTYLPTYLSID